MNIESDSEFAKQALELLTTKLNHAKETDKALNALNLQRWIFIGVKTPEEPKRKVTKKFITGIWDLMAPWLREHGAIVAGGFVSSFIKWDEKKIPGDMDIWFPSFVKPSSIWSSSPIGPWKYHTSYSIGKNSTMPPNVKRITEYTHAVYDFKLQLIFTTEVNPYNIIENFDYDVCKGVMSPGLDDRGNVIGIRATKPEVFPAILSNIATFKARPWDMDDKNQPNQKAIDRYRKYKEKGYELRTHKESPCSIEMIEAAIERLDKEKLKDPKQTSSYGPEEGAEMTYFDVVMKINSYNYTLSSLLYPYDETEASVIRINESAKIHLPFYLQGAIDCNPLTEGQNNYTRKSMFEEVDRLDQRAIQVLIQMYEKRINDSNTTDPKYFSCKQIYERRKAKKDAENAKIISSYINTVYS